MKNPVAATDQHHRPWGLAGGNGGLDYGVDAGETGRADGRCLGSQR